MLLALGDRVTDVIRLLDHTAQTWAGNQQPRGIESSQDRLVLVSGAVMKGAVEDGDGMPGEVHPVAVDGGTDQAGTGGNLQPGEAVPPRRCDQ
jgi:hypothetical protein